MYSRNSRIQTACFCRLTHYVWFRSRWFDRQGRKRAREIFDYEGLVDLRFLAIVHPPAVTTPMAELYPSIAQCAIVATALKVLLFPA